MVLWIIESCTIKNYNESGGGKYENQNEMVWIYMKSFMKALKCYNMTLWPCLNKPNRAVSRNHPTTLRAPMMQRHHGWWWELMGQWDRITLHCWVSWCESSYQGKEGSAEDIRVNLGSQCTVSADVQSLSNGCTRSANILKVVLCWVGQGPYILVDGLASRIQISHPQLKHARLGIYPTELTTQYLMLILHPSPTWLKHASPIFDTDPTPVHLM